MLLRMNDMDKKHYFSFSGYTVSRMPKPACQILYQTK